MVIERRSGDWSPQLTQTEMAGVLHVAWDGLRAAVCGAQQAPTPLGAGSEGAFAERRATFVTLHTQGKLRGCIGELEATRPLLESVWRNAGRAATQDPRFPAVREAEVEALTLDVTVLGPWEDAVSAAAFVPGRHGVLLEKDGRRAVFLPQVATEQGWTAEQTLEALAKKGGLPSGAWREGASLRLFESIMLCEENR